MSPQARLRRLQQVQGRLVAGATAVVLLLGLSLVAVSSHHAASAVDSFYAAPTSTANSPRPGRLLHTERFTRGIPSSAEAWRILYTTTRADGAATVASGLVLIGKNAPAGARPVLAWAHGTSGVARDCAPTMLADPFGSGVREDLGAIIRNHWILVATDYEGLGAHGSSPYLVGSSEGRAVLDAVRAARTMPQLSVSDQTVVWGHSQGGGAALWADKIQPQYAPDVPLSGVAAVSPTSDMPAVAASWSRARNPVTEALTAYLVTAYAHVYRDVHLAQYVRPATRRRVNELSRECVRQAERLASVTPRAAVLDRSTTSGPLATRLRQNTPTTLGNTPLLVAWGGSDGLIPAPIQRSYVRSLCAQGTALQSRQYPGRGHDSVLEGDSPLLPTLIRWTQARLAGQPVVDDCSTRTAVTS